jgi:outer membrane lipopolysaccharide assembly protein LptE/RlpB
MRLRLKTFLLICAFAITVTATGGCGFQPRGHIELGALPGPVHIAGLGQYTDLYRELSLLLKSADVPVSLVRDDSATTIRILKQETDSRLLTVDSLNRLVEYELEQSVQFDILNGNGEAISEPQTTRVVRILFQPPADILASRRESELVVGDMQRELAQLILTRVAAQR